LIVQGQKGLSLVAPVGSSRLAAHLSSLMIRLMFQIRSGLHTMEIYSHVLVFIRCFRNGKIIFKSHIGTYSVPVLGAVLYSLLGVDTSNFPHFQSTATSPLQFPDVFGGQGAYLANCNTPGTIPGELLYLQLSRISSCQR